MICIRGFTSVHIGNAVFHDDTLCRDFEAVIPVCLRLIQTESDDRSRANAASVLGNLVRHTSQLYTSLQQSGAVSVLMDRILEDSQHQPESAAAQAALFALGNFCACPVLKQEMVQNDVHVLLQKVGSSTHPRVLRFGKRLCEKLQTDDASLAICKQ